MDFEDRNYSFQSAGKIVVGNHCTRSIVSHLGVFDTVRRVLIITSPSIQRLGYIKELERQFSGKGISVDILSGIMAEPTVEHIEEQHRNICDLPYDIYIGVGGGSVLDVTKILAVMKTNPEPISTFLGIDQIKQQGIPTILIPTTSGTGSEVTPNAIVTLPKDELKVGIVSRHLFAQLAFLDPMFTVDLPKPLTASTGVDAFTHALESYIGNKANPISDMYALESIRLISRSILSAYHDGSSITAREDMLLGSMYGGVALTNSGTAAVHALAYPLGGKFNIPHGVSNAMLLPHVMEFNMEVILEKMLQVGTAMGLNISGMRPIQASLKVLDEISFWIQQLEIPQNLKPFHVTEQDVDGLASSALKVTRLLHNNPKPLNYDDVRKIYMKLMS